MGRLPQARGFTEGTPWLPVNPGYPRVNAAARPDDPGSVFHHNRQLIELRHAEPAVVHGDFHPLAPREARVHRRHTR